MTKRAETNTKHDTVYLIVHESLGVVGASANDHYGAAHGISITVAEQYPDLMPCFRMSGNHKPLPAGFSLATFQWGAAT